MNERSLRWLQMAARVRERERPYRPDTPEQRAETEALVEAMWPLQAEVLARLDTDTPEGERK